MLSRPASAVFFDLPAKWQDAVKKNFKTGMSDVEVFVSLGVSREEHNAMLKDVDEYRIAFENGMAIAEAYWMKWARENINNPSKDVNTKIFEKFMNRLFQWDRKIEEPKDKEKSDGAKKEGGKLAQKYLQRAK